MCLFFILIFCYLGIVIIFVVESHVAVLFKSDFISAINLFADASSLMVIVFNEVQPLNTTHVLVTFDVSQ